MGIPNSDLATGHCSCRSQCARKIPACGEHCLVNRLGGVRVRETGETRRVADDPCQAREPPQVQGVVAKGQEEEDIGFSHVGRTENHTLRRSSHRDELFGKLVCRTASSVKEGDAFRDCGRYETFSCRQRGLEPALILDKAVLFRQAAAEGRKRIPLLTGKTVQFWYLN